MILRRFFTAALLWCVSFSLVQGATDIRMYLNRGDYIAVDSTTYPYYAFNYDAVFDAHNAVLNVATGDTVVFTIINTDTLDHGFTIKGYPGSGSNINPLDSIVDTVVFNTPGLFIYHDDFDYPKYTYLGAAGMILVESPNSFSKFYWNFKEQQDSYNFDLVNGVSVNWAAFDPNYYTVNSRSKPDIPNDTTAVVIANVGDTVRIMMANTGRSVHSIHFHGFHCRIVYASQSSQMLNWSKDTVPIKSMEAIILEMVPDKSGFYPVHDHNLIAVGGGGYYPNGIFMMMQIN